MTIAIEGSLKLGVIGLGYVGLPLSVAFAKKFSVVGFDISTGRIRELRNGFDRTGEVPKDELHKLKGRLTFSSNTADLAPCQIYIVTVPTPIDSFKRPDLTPLLTATEIVGGVLEKGALIIYESTVYPGCTEEDCVPLLEKRSGLVYNSDFFVGYSPERINPGDKVNTLTSIKKIVSGSTPDAAKIVNQLYNSIITAGTYMAPSIKVAEAAKAIENAQRDLNISFMNELSLIFDRLGIDTDEVINAASTKWNFMKFKPGLVGGHCIGVDPYYLSYKAEQVGYIPQVILAGRRVNDQMGAFVANKVVKLMIAKGHPIKHPKALILGFTFKENCGDIRNTRVIDTHNELKQFGFAIDVYDPLADAELVEGLYNVKLIKSIEYKAEYDVVILAVAHHKFLSLDYKRLKKRNGIVFDCKSVLDRSIVDGRL